MSTAYQGKLLWLNMVMSRDCVAVPTTAKIQSKSAFYGQLLPTVTKQGQCSIPALRNWPRIGCIAAASSS